jgi:Putative peptidoglycan binding domain
MKTIKLFLGIGLMLLTRSLDAGERGGGVGFALPARHASNAAAPAVMAPSQHNVARTAPQPRINVRPQDSPQLSAKPAGQVRSLQNQDQSRTNARNSGLAALRQDRHQAHDRDWWRRHFRTIVVVLGGYYYWDDGYWYPAWGYDPNYSYDDDGPIYAYGNLLPDQVIANVQAQLQQDGYYAGPITGSFNPSTRAALANYQRDHGLIVTATVDEPTVESLGLT